MKSPLLLSVLISLLLLASLMIWPQIDLTLSRFFYTQDKGFLLAEHPLFLALHSLAYYGARVLGVVLAVLTGVTLLRRQPFWGIPTKGWLFLFLALMLGPVLLANVVLKDHWGRARPHEVREFGGSASFSPAWVPQPSGHKNSSFVAGDAAFGFYLASFAYVFREPSRRKRHNLSRRVFWGGFLVGFIFGAARIAMGGHFFSDVFFAAFFMFAASALLYALMYGRKATAMTWRYWLFMDRKKVVR